MWRAEADKARSVLSGCSDPRGAWGAGPRQGEALETATHSQAL